MAFIISITSKVQDGSLTRDNIQWLETVFRDNVGEGQTEFTLNQFKKIVPSKNVGVTPQRVKLTELSSLLRRSSWRAPSESSTRTGRAPSLWRSSWRRCISSPTRGTRRNCRSCSRYLSDKGRSTWSHVCPGL